MHTPLAIYLASILGAVALLLIMPKQQWNYRAVGAVLGAAALGGLWFVAYGELVAKPDPLTGLSWNAFAYYYIFSAIAIVGAVRVITHTRPVYSALWFVLVVLASAGLFLVLSAEFMAFAMLIIYAGAILVTYMFVIMLATQSAPETAPGSPSPPANEPDVSPDYDRVAREPLGAIVAGFLLLAVLLTVAFQPVASDPQRTAMRSDQEIVETVLTRQPQLRIERQLQAQLDLNATAGEQTAALSAGPVVSNVERVGLDLFESHPLGLELAGVILLVALIGAVVIAKTRVEEEEKLAPPVPDETGATIHPRGEPGPHSPQARGQSGGRLGT